MAYGTGLMTGRMVGAGQIAGMMYGNFGIEILYSFVIIVCSLMIYFSTKELYELTNHKGLKYFRLAFLFFAISYGLRALVKLMILYFGRSTIHPGTLNHFSLGFLLYFSVMAIFFLLYSVLCKNWKHSKWRILVAQGIAILIAVITPLFRNRTYPILINMLLLALVLITVIFAYRETRNKKKGLNLLGIYVLLSFFWILNIVDIMTPNFLSKFQLFVYIVSIGVFMSILYKVLTKTGGR